MRRAYKFCKCSITSIVKKLYTKARQRAARSSLRYRCHKMVLQWALRSNMNARIYYALFSRSFIREQYACLYGKLKYKENLETPRSDQRYLLRRNIHRLEKGLLMIPRREIFALDYIEETVNAYILHTPHAQISSTSADEELLWAHDVLAEYFQVISYHPIIAKIEKNFRRTAPLNGTGDSKKSLPYTRQLNQIPAVTYENFIELSKQRRSVRWYLQKKVPRTLIDQAVTAATHAPSACNRQPFVFYIFDEQELVSKLARLPMGTSGYDHNIPVIVVVVGRLRAYFDDRDRHLIYIDGALAAMSFMLALETLGLSSCPINWPDMEEREQRAAELLALAPDERPIMLISVGYPDPEGKVAFSAKKPLQLLRRYNFE